MEPEPIEPLPVEPEPIEPLPLEPEPIEPLPLEPEVLSLDDELLFLCFFLVEVPDWPLESVLLLPDPIVLPELPD